MGIRSKLHEMREIAGAAVWCLRNYRELYSFRRETIHCDDCSRSNEFDSDKLCDTHRDKYDTFVEHGPYTSNQSN